jgi:hypothetical protein
MSEAYRPFGNKDVITQEDQDWITAQLADFGIDNKLGEAERLEKLKAEVERAGIDVDKIVGDTFFLSSEPVKIVVGQDEERTTLFFLANEERLGELNYRDLYRLFFQELPESIYGEGPFTPMPEFVQNSTIVTLKTKPDLPRKFDLVFPTNRESLEDFLEYRNNEVISITMATRPEKVIPFSLTLPNFKFKNGIDDVQFSFSSGNILTQETMEVLLGLHENGGKLNGELDVCARAFAAGINAIRGNVRIR